VRKLTLAEADVIIDATLAKGRELGLGKLSVVVLDDGGHPIAMKRDDGSEYLRPEIAKAKAWGALGMGLPSRLLHERAKKLPVFISVPWPPLPTAGWSPCPVVSSSATRTVRSWGRWERLATSPSPTRSVP
jgi:uncharacterized protein GlcG (DUF336 family)